MTLRLHGWLNKNMDDVKAAGTQSERRQEVSGSFSGNLFITQYGPDYVEIEYGKIRLYGRPFVRIRVDQNFEGPVYAVRPGQSASHVWNLHGKVNEHPWNYFEYDLDLDEGDQAAVRYVLNNNRTVRLVEIVRSIGRARVDCHK